MSAGAPPPSAALVSIMVGKKRHRSRITRVAGCGEDCVLTVRMARAVPTSLGR
jgi:hypothetical protein